MGLDDKLAMRGWGVAAYAEDMGTQEVTWKHAVNVGLGFALDHFEIFP